MRTKSLGALFVLALLAMWRPAFLSAVASAKVEAGPSSITAQSDLDAFMERVLARRDDNWKKLQQYVLEEKEAFDLTGPGRLPLWGMRREYSWFIRQGIFVRSPVTANGVALSESDRRKAEEEWLRRERNREERRKRRAEREKQGLPAEPENRAVVISPTGVQVVDQTPTTAADLPSNVDDLLKQGGDPQFVSAAYFLRFRFEKGHYALAGREPVDGRETLKIEYYPAAGLFNDGRSRPNRRVRDKEDEIEEKMNKVSLVTLWVDPKTHQILQYTFDDIDMDFFPGRALARVSDLKATMRMGQPFPDVWLPRTIEMRFGMMFAVGAVDASYKVEYLNYKQADVTYKIK